MASADTAATNFWIGGNSAGGGWNTAGNWSAGVPTAGQVIAFRNGDSVAITADDLATALAVGGIDLAGAGTELHLQKDATAGQVYPAIHLADGTTLYIPVGANSTVKALNGSGVVANTSSTQRNLTIGESGSTILSEFSGRFDGKITIYANSFVRFLGTESTSTGGMIVYRNKTADNGAPLYGVAEVVKFGTSGDSASSIGKPPTNFDNPSVTLRFSGWLTYIGTGETTDRHFQFRYQPEGKHAYPDTLDAGAFGGVTFTGIFETSHSGSYGSTIALTGSNTVPCVIAGQWNDPTSGGTGFIYKRGTGTWRFADNTGRKNRNAFAVEEGTLQFDSIAETNEVCSLGLASLLQKPYIGTYTTANNVDYAYLLGGSTTNVVFEYTGSNYCCTTTRPIALKGSGAWLKSSSPSDSGGVSIAGVSAQTEGAEVKTLWLAGTNLYSRVGEISDGAGRVGVTKEGSGTWTLVGNQTFTGPLSVREGTLNVARKQKYTWFRFTVKESTQIFYVDDVGLFNSSGERLNAGLSVIDPQGLEISGSYSYYSSPNDYRTLQPGQATVATTKRIAYFSSASYHLSGLFDNATAKCWRSASETTGEIPAWDKDRFWIPVVFRLPADADEAASCDIVLKNTANKVTGFSIDGSCDGVVWKNLINRRTSDGTLDTSKIGVWQSDLSTFPTAGDTHIPAESWRFVGHEGSDDASSLTNVSAIAVAPGATLRATGDLPVTLHCLTLDAVNGNGTVDGFDFAEDGFVDVVGMASGVPQCDVAITLANLPDGALARLNGWSVRLNGVPRSKTSVKFDGTKATVRRPGTMISIR